MNTSLVIALPCKKAACTSMCLIFQLFVETSINKLLIVSLLHVGESFRISLLFS